MLVRKSKPSPSSTAAAERPPNVLYPHPNEFVPSTHSSCEGPHTSSPAPSQVHKCPLDARESLDRPLTASEPPPPPLVINVIGGKPHPDNQARPDLRTHKLVKQYTMNGATCVRAYDYLRRYFVLRICADGQQFMVQLNSYPETIEWLAVSILFLGGLSSVGRAR
jgi:hypothetical protein